MLEAALALRRGLRAMERRVAYAAVVEVAAGPLTAAGQAEQVR